MGMKEQKTYQQLVDLEFERDACRERRADLANQVARMKQEMETLVDRIDEIGAELDAAEEEMEAQRLAEVSR